MKDARSPLLRSPARLISLGVVAAALVLFGFTDVFGPDSIDREEAEKAAKRALTFENEREEASEVTCPRDLEWRTGDSMVCTYTDFLSDTIGSIVDPGNPNRPPPKTGRLEVRVSGFDKFFVGRRLWSEPEFEVRVIDPAR